MKDIDHFQAVVFLQNKDFIPVTTDASRKKQVIEHAEIVKLKVVHGRQFNSDSLKKAVQANSIEDLRYIEKQEGKQEIPEVRTPDEPGKFCNIGFFQDQIKCQNGDKKLEKWF